MVLSCLFITTLSPKNAHLKHHVCKKYHSLARAKARAQETLARPRTPAESYEVLPTLLMAGFALVCLKRGLYPKSIQFSITIYPFLRYGYPFKCDKWEYAPLKTTQSKSHHSPLDLQGQDRPPPDSKMTGTVDKLLVRCPQLASRASAALH